MKKKSIKVIVIVIAFIMLATLIYVKMNKEDGYEAYEGTYRYVYPYTASLPSEDHYIVLESHEGTLRGYYYGTTDDFDEAREGYKPGYFVSELKNISINENEINFSIQLFKEDIFTDPVDLKFKSKDDPGMETNEVWINAALFDRSEGVTRAYRGTIEADQLILDMNTENRIYDRVNE